MSVHEVSKEAELAQRRQELEEALEWIRSHTQDALVEILAAKASNEKSERRMRLLDAGGRLHGVVGVIEMLLKVEPAK